MTMPLFFWPTKSLEAHHIAISNKTEDDKVEELTEDQLTDCFRYIFRYLNITP